MILPYFLSSLFLSSNVLARPLLPLVLSDNYPRETISTTNFTHRSEASIIWSCLATLFVCSWVAIHPNIPAPSDSRLRIFARRLLMMLYTLLVPEIVIIWAGRQYYAAYEISQRNRERGWTKTHAFFALMGGFMLYEDGVMSRTLAPDELEHLFADGQIDWPIISEKGIKDRSKGDFLSKGFAVLQTTWFITQCIVRGVYGLALSQFEVVTVAFSVMNAVVYFLWWNKPMDVACPVPVHLLPPMTDARRPSSTIETGIQTADQCHSAQAGSNNSCQIPSPDHELPTVVSVASSETETIDALDDPHFVTKLEIELACPLELPSSVPLRQPPSTFVQMCSYIGEKFSSMGPFALIYILICEPVRIIWSNLHDMLECDTMDNSNTHSTQSVPTFYAPHSQKGGFSMVIGLSVAALFGGIHCTTWSFPFSSITEQQLWRFSAITVVVVPISFMVLIAVGALIVVIFFRHHRGPCATFINIFLGLFVILILLAYTVARVVLLVLPLLALHSLSSGSFVDVDWLVYIPHI